MLRGKLLQLRAISKVCGHTCEGTGTGGTGQNEGKFMRRTIFWNLGSEKAQGSQFKRVIVPITKSRLLDRTLTYTALTRGIERVVFIGDRDAFERAIIAQPQFRRAPCRILGMNRGPRAISFFLQPLVVWRDYPAILSIDSQPTGGINGRCDS
jgi:hypothetical protein